jgi:anti-sigma B factor antagonist
MSDLSEALRLSTTDTASRSRLEVNGDIDFATVDDLRDHLARLVQDGAGDIDVDMSGVGFCDATGLRALLAAHHALADGGRHIRIVDPATPVVRLLQLAGIDTNVVAKPPRGPQHRPHVPTRVRRARELRRC